MSYIELLQPIYKGAQFRKYLDQIERSENPDPDEQWKSSLSDPLEPPTPMKSRIKVDPSKIISYCETFSLSESQSDTPKFDMVDIVMETGYEFSVYGTISSLERKIADHNKNK